MHVWKLKLNVHHDVLQHIVRDFTIYINSDSPLRSCLSPRWQGNRWCLYPNIETTVDWAWIFIDIGLREDYLCEVFLDLDWCWTWTRIGLMLDYPWIGHPSLIQPTIVLEHLLIFCNKMSLHISAKCWMLLMCIALISKSIYRSLIALMWIPAARACRVMTSTLVAFTPRSPKTVPALQRLIGAVHSLFVVYLCIPYPPAVALCGAMVPTATWS